MIADRIVHGALRHIANHNAETAHNAAISIMRFAQKSPWVLEQIADAYRPQNPVPVEVCGMKFPHRIGVAAGLDKQGLVLPFLQAVGFGFVEVGSVLPQPQVGNPKPRFFVLPEARGAINRFGFNSHGVKAVKQNLGRSSPSIRIPIGISLGVNKEDVGDERLMHAGHRFVIALTESFASYYALNVSSPNTINLRDLQSVDKIRTTAQGVVRIASAHEKPVFVKFAPDMPDDELKRSAMACLEVGVSGFIATNTTLSRDAVTGEEHSSEVGGLSGVPLFDRALECVKILRSVDADVSIIGVGGVADEADAKAMFASGADLVQFYTALFHQGPIALRRISGE